MTLCVAYAGLQQAADQRTFNLRDVATKGGWGAAGGLVAGTVLGGAARVAQKPHIEYYQPNVLQSEHVFRIPAPSNIYTAKAVQDLVHAPRAMFGSLSKMAGQTVQ